MNRTDLLGLTFQEKAVLASIEHAAEAGTACPSNTAFADELSIGASKGSDIIARLERKGLIKVQRGNSMRVVTIVATGKRTAGEITKPHWRLRDKAAPCEESPRRERREQPVPIPALRDDPPRVHRDPCFFCGARADACECGKAVRA